MLSKTYQKPGEMLSKTYRKPVEMLSMNSGMIASTSFASARSSDSFGLMHSQVKCLIPNIAARLGSYSVNCRK